jgi:predicted permease
MKETLSNIVLFCGGANVKFLRENCPNERHKFYPIGLGVIITAFLGFISMMFATHSIFGANSFGEEIVLILFSFFWAFAIFTIDWGLVKTMRKSKNEDPTIGERIRLALPIIFRLLVALILSFSISRPMEVKIYEKRLKAQIETDRQIYVERVHAIWRKPHRYRISRPQCEGHQRV